MLEHNRNLRPDLPSNLRPLRTWAKRERLRRRRVERRAQQDHRLHMRVEHHLRRDLTVSRDILRVGGQGEIRTSFSWPVR